MDNVKKIKKAINQSKEENRIVDIEIEKDIDSIIDLVLEASDIEFDWKDIELDNIIDVWGWNDDTPENQYEWRIYIKSNYLKNHLTIYK